MPVRAVPRLARRAGKGPVSVASAARWARPLLFIVPALWSSNYLVARLSAPLIAPHALALGRWALAMLLLLPGLRELGIMQLRGSGDEVREAAAESCCGDRV